MKYVTPTIELQYIIMTQYNFRAVNHIGKSVFFGEKGSIISGDEIASKTKHIDPMLI